MAKGKSKLKTDGKKVAWPKTTKKAPTGKGKGGKKKGC